MVLLRNVLLLAGALFLLTASSCKKDENPTDVDSTPITDDLFPLTAGHQLVFSGYLRDKTADTNMVFQTGAFYQGRMTVGPTTNLTPDGSAGTVLIDSSRVHPAPIWVARNFVIRKASTTGPYDFVTNIGLFYRTFGINRADSLRWVVLVRQDLGIGTEWSAFDSTWTIATGSVRLEVVCKVEGREMLSLGGQSFNAYKVVATRRVYLGGASVPSVTGATATVWLEPNIGIVKFIYNADGETPGFYREYASRNF
jgi:hypothetical protein